MDERIFTVVWDKAEDSVSVLNPNINEEAGEEVLFVGTEARCDGFVDGWLARRKQDKAQPSHEDCLSQMFADEMGRMHP